MKILIADDDENVLEIFKSFFEGEGHEVLTAVNGNEAFIKLQEKPDILLTDINMPICDGFELIHLVRDSNDTLPIVVMSGLEDNLKIALECGATEAVVKGNVNVILEAVKKITLKEKVCL